MGHALKPCPAIPPVLPAMGQQIPAVLHAKSIALSTLLNVSPAIKPQESLDVTLALQMASLSSVVAALSVPFLGVRAS
ncbi:unnamed protein product [Sphagnum balticum]